MFGTSPVPQTRKRDIPGKNNWCLIASRGAYTRTRVFRVRLTLMSRPSLHEVQEDQKAKKNKVEKDRRKEGNSKDRVAEPTRLARRATPPTFGVVNRCLPRCRDSSFGSAKSGLGNSGTHVMMESFDCRV
ncbi:hypothetical protein ABKN59_008181 [Abortiporus biennis]